MNITRRNSREINSLLSRFRRCLVNVEEGVAYIQYLDNHNSHYYEDGTPADLSGREGDVMVYFPEFWYKYEKISDTVCRYYISETEIEDGIHIRESLVGAYEGYVLNKKLYSRSHVVSNGLVSRTEFKEYATNRGPGFQLIDFQQHSVLAMMFYAKYLNRNSRLTLGFGLSGTNTPMGTTNHLGNRDTADPTSTYVNFLGVEAVYGGKYELVDGVDINNLVWTITTPGGTVREVQSTLPDPEGYAEGFVKSFQLEKGPWFDMVPMEIGGGAYEHYTDYCIYNAEENRVMARSFYNNYSGAGFGFSSTNGSRATKDENVGTRLAFYGPIEVIPAKQYATITFDKSMADPANISGDINKGTIKRILNRFRRCLAKKTAEGEVDIAYLDDSDSNYYEDGSPAILTGEEGDVMVHIPAFYYRYEKVDENRFSYHFSLQKIDENWIKVPESLVGAYEAFVEDQKLYSRSGVFSTENISQENFKQYAATRGSGYGIIHYQQHCLIAMLFYAKYGNRDSQAVLGAGSDTYQMQGTSNATGMRDTDSTISGHPTFLGIESVHGGKYELVDGVTIHNYVWNITDPETGEVRQVTATSGYGVWIKELAAAKGPHFDVIPIQTVEQDGTYYSDMYYSAATSGNILSRSFNLASTFGGVAFTHTTIDPTVASPLAGSRLSFYGTINPVDVNTFRLFAHDRS